LRRNGVYNVADRAREIIDGATRDAVGAERWPVFRGVGYIAVSSADRATSDGNTTAVACDTARYTAPRRNSGSGGSNCRATWSTAESRSNPVWTRICRPECTVRGAFSAIAEPLARNRRRSFPRAAIFVRHRRIYDRHALRRRPTSLSESTRTRIMTPGARQRDRIKCTVVRCRGGGIFGAFGAISATQCGVGRVGRSTQLCVHACPIAGQTSPARPPRLNTGLMSSLAAGIMPC